MDVHYQEPDERSPLPPRPARTQILRVDALLDQLRHGVGEIGTHAMPLVPTGYDILDDALEGGLRPHDLVLLGGLPGVGKTVAALQWARTMAKSGRSVLYACYEHDPLVLVARLLLMEAGSPDSGLDVAERDMARQVVREHMLGGAAEDIATFLETDLYATHLLGRVQSYAERLTLLSASGAHTDLRALADAVRGLENTDAVLFVDYLQKVAVRPEPGSETEKVRLVTEGLKDLALELTVPVVAIVAAEQSGLTAPRLRSHHLRGSSALAYEADVIVMLNDKAKAVSKVHLAYDTARAANFFDWTVFSLEKNRSGRDAVDLEFRKDFRHYRFVPEGNWVSERLVDERLEEV